MELVMTNIPAPAQIEFNFDELKAYLENSLIHYNSLIVTKDDIQGAKCDRANLNKLKKALEDKRKEVKKTCLAPYEDFESKIRELTSLIDEPIGCIDSQIKSFEEADKKQKEAEVKSLFENHKSNHKTLAWLSFDQIFNEKWLNKTCSLSSIEKEIEEEMFKCENNIKIIKAMKLGVHETPVMNAYKQTLDMGKALDVKSLCDTEGPKSTGDKKTMSVVFYDTTPEFRKTWQPL